MNIIKKVLEKILDAEIDGAATSVMYYPPKPTAIQNYEKERRVRERKTRISGIEYE